MSKTINTNHEHQGQSKAQIASFACVVHCIVTPLIIVVAPFMGSILHNVYLEVGILLLSIICGVIVIHNGYCSHKRRHTILLFGVGASLWALHSLVEHLGIHGFEVALLLLGTIFVLGSYYFNHRLLKCCPEH